MSEQFVIQVNENFFVFVFKDENDDILLYGRLFPSIVMCRKGIEELRASAGSPDSFALFTHRNGQHSFVLRGFKGIMLGYSPMYWDIAAREAAIQKLREQIEQAPVIVIDKP
jgi:uncharacterized protein YegP (UPF0339 family)